MGRQKKYFTEEEKLAAKREYMREYMRRYNQEHKEKRAEYYQKNKEKIKARNKQYKQGKLAAKREANRRWRKRHPEYDKQYQQEHKEKRAEYKKKYYQKHKEKIAEYNKKYKQEHKECQRQYRTKHQDYMKQWRQTPMGRAHSLLSGYRRLDKEAGRGECTIPNAQWIVDNIFTQKCHWCPETDWTKIGCDRIDNSLPHTPDNVIPCCGVCNNKRGTKTYEEFKKEINNFKF